MRIGKLATIALAAMALMAPHAMRAQTQATDEAAQKNAQQAREKLDAMVKALGGQAWLDMKNEMQQGHVAAFFQGNPDLGTEDLFEFHEWPDHDRIEVTKHRDVVEFFVGRQGWEVTYRGKKPHGQGHRGRLSAAARPLHRDGGEGVAQGSEHHPALRGRAHGRAPPGANR